MPRSSEKKRRDRVSSMCDGPRCNSLSVRRERKAASCRPLSHRQLLDLICYATVLDACQSIRRLPSVAIGSQTFYHAVNRGRQSRVLKSGRLKSFDYGSPSDLHEALTHLWAGRVVHLSRTRSRPTFSISAVPLFAKDNDSLTWCWFVFTMKASLLLIQKVFFN